MRCEFIKAHRGGFGPIRKACETLHVSKSEHCDYSNRPKPGAQMEREALEGFVVEKFELHRGQYGYRRINREPRRDGTAVGEKRAPAAMRRPGLKARARREGAGGRSRPRRATRARASSTASSTRTPGTGSGSAPSPISTPINANLKTASWRVSHWR